MIVLKHEDAIACFLLRCSRQDFLVVTAYLAKKKIESTMYRTQKKTHAGGLRSGAG